MGSYANNFRQGSELTVYYSTIGRNGAIFIKFSPYGSYFTVDY